MSNLPLQLFTRLAVFIVASCLSAQAFAYNNQQQYGNNNYNSGNNTYNSGYGGGQQTTQVEVESISMRDLAIYSYKPSYVGAERASAILSAFGYPVVEITQQSNSSNGTVTYQPKVPPNIEPPVIFVLPDAPKTSLMDQAKGQQQNFNQNNGGGGLRGGNAVPDIGGTYLHGVTTGEEQQRMLIGYNEDDPKSLEKVIRILDTHVDVPAPQIVIEALVIEVNKDKLRDVGFNSQGIFKRWTADFVRDDQDRQLPSVFTFNDSIPNAVGQFQASIKALVTKGDAEVLSNPSVLVLDGRQARIQVGQQIPVTTSTATNSFVQAQVDYFPVGIVLNLRPRVSADETEVSMQVETIVSAVNAQASASTDNVERAPVVDNRQVQTFVRVANNTPFIIGGLISTEETTAIQGIPGLSSIPVLGRLFQRRTTERSKTEVIVVLTPHVVPHGDTKFSYTRPKDSKVFDSSNNELYLDRYRVRDKEVFDLGFLKDTPMLAKAQKATTDWMQRYPDRPVSENMEKLAEGGIPGEDILVRRMLWETVRSQEYAEYVNPDKLVMFVRDTPDAAPRFGFLKKLLEDLDDETALVLSFPPQESSGFEQPAAFIEEVSLKNADYTSLLRSSNQDGYHSIVLSKSGAGRIKPLEWLQSAAVLKRVIDLNNSIPMDLDSFYTGLQLTYPTEEDLSSGFHLIGPELAKYWYEVQEYYPAFERELNNAFTEVETVSGNDLNRMSEPSDKKRKQRFRRR